MNPKNIGSYMEEKEEEEAEAFLPGGKIMWKESRLADAGRVDLIEN